MARSNELKMTEGSIVKNVVLFSIPLMLSGMLQLLYNAADIVVVGRFAGSEALAAVGSTSSLVNLMTNLFIGISVGTSVTIATAYGANNYQKTQDALHTSVALSLIFGILTAVFGLFFSRKALEIMQSPADVIDLSTLYLRIYFLGMPAMMFYNFGAMALRAIGDTKRPLYFLTIAGVVNVILNLITVIGFGMGVAGVAIATVVAQYVSALLVFISLIKECGFLQLEIKEIKLHKEECLQILKIGIPAGVQSTVFSLSNVIIQSSINSFGTKAIAGNAAASSIEGFVYIAMNAVHHAAVTIVGQNFGARKFERISKSVGMCVGFVTVLGLVLAATAILFINPLLSIYNTDPEVISYGRIRIIILATYFTCGIMEVLVGGLRGLGNSFVPMIVSIIGVCGIRIGWIFTIFAMHKTLITLYLSYPVSWIITSSIHLICFFVYKKKRIEREEERIADSR